MASPLLPGGRFFGARSRACGWMGTTEGMAVLVGHVGEMDATMMPASRARRGGGSSSLFD